MHEIADVQKLAKRWKVNLEIKTAQIYDYENGSDLIPENEKYSRYAHADQKFQIKNSFFNHCWRMWHSAVITWDGKVVPCCFDKDAAHQLGNLQNQSFASIWKSEEYNKFRNQLLTNRKEIDICENCSEGSKVYI